MAKDRTLAFIGGGSSDAVWKAPKGTTMPTGLAAPGAGWVEVGWLGEDGIERNSNIDKKDFKAHQGGTIIRRKVTGSGRTAQFTCLENNLEVLGIVHPGIVWVDNTTYVQGTVPEVITTAEYAWIIDSYDGSTLWREKFTAGEATLTGAYKFGVEDMVAYQFELGLYGDPVIVSNHAGLITLVT